MLGLLSTAGYLACNAPEFLLEILEEEEIAFVRRHHQNHKTDGKVHLRISNLLRRTRSATSELLEVYFRQERLQRATAAVVAWATCGCHSFRGNDITFECSLT